MYDAIVVGARCAGAPTAMLLARAGLDVLLVDRATFPSDIAHGHFIHRHGPRRLRDWGLLDRIVAAGCPAVTEMTTDYTGEDLTGRNLVVDGVAMGYGPRRSVLDGILVNAAVEAGAELRTGIAVEGFLSDDGAITGVRCIDRATGSPFSERATIVVGADGRNSLLARTVQAPQHDAVPTLTCWFFSYWSGVRDRGLEVHIRDNRVSFSFPTNDGLYAVFVAWPIAELAAVRADVERAFLAVLDRVGDLGSRVRAGRREERFLAATELPNYFRKPWGPGWALVGDAGCHKDPFLALGCCDAFRDADLLASALAAGLSGRRPLAEALADYERQRNDATTPDYRQNLSAAQFKPLPDEQYRLLAALRGQQADIDRFYMAREGMIPPDTFFNPDNVERIMRAAAPR